MVAFSASILNIPPKPRLTYRSFLIAFAFRLIKIITKLSLFNFISSGSVCANSNAELHKKRETEYMSIFD
jgi:hypothetical protein